MSLQVDLHRCVWHLDCNQALPGSRTRIKDRGVECPFLPPRRWESRSQLQLPSWCCLAGLPTQLQPSWGQRGEPSEVNSASPTGIAAADRAADPTGFGEADRAASPIGFGEADRVACPTMIAAAGREADPTGIGAGDRAASPIGFAAAGQEASRTSCGARGRELERTGGRGQHRGARPVQHQHQHQHSGLDQAGEVGLAPARRRAHLMEAPLEGRGVFLYIWVVAKERPLGGVIAAEPDQHACNS